MRRTSIHVCSAVRIWRMTPSPESGHISRFLAIFAHILTYWHNCIKINLLGIKSEKYRKICWNEWAFMYVQSFAFGIRFHHRNRPRVHVFLSILHTFLINIHCYIKTDLLEIKFQNISRNFKRVIVTFVPISRTNSTAEICPYSTFVFAISAYSLMILSRFITDAQ